MFKPIAIDSNRPKNEASTPTLRNTIDRPLLDRMEVIELAGYTVEVGLGLWGLGFRTLGLIRSGLRLLGFRLLGFRP